MSQIQYMLRNTCIMKKTFLIAALISISLKSFAHPVSYQGSTSVMTWNQPFLNDFMVNHSFRKDMAIALRNMRMQMPGNEMKANFLQGSYLLKRWNEIESQSNIYVFGGVGLAREFTNSQFLKTYGFEIDSESRIYYVSAKFQGLVADKITDVYQAQLRIGVATYPSEFNEIASWLIISLQYEPQLIRQWIATPMMRFFYKNVLWELGSSLEGDVMTNFMVHF